MTYNSHRAAILFNLYYPDLRLPKGTDYPIGKFGYMRCEHLKKFKHGYYMELLLDGKLNEYLHDVDEECHEMLDRIVEQMKKKQGLTEKLKAENQMLWVRKIKTFGFVVKSKLRRNLHSAERSVHRCVLERPPCGAKRPPV